MPNLYHNIHFKTLTETNRTHLTQIPHVWPLDYVNYPALHDMQQPTALPIGVALFPTWFAQEQQVSIWKIEIVPCTQNTSHQLLESWTRAIELVVSLAPYIEANINISELGYTLEWVTGQKLDGKTPACPERDIIGRSADLAFCTALLSYITKKPFPENVCLSGALSPTGETIAVHQIPNKYNISTQILPRLKYFISSAPLTETVTLPDNFIHISHIDEILRRFKFSLDNFPHEKLIQIFQSVMIPNQHRFLEWQVVLNMTQEFIEHTSLDLRFWACQANNISKRHLGLGNNDLTEIEPPPTLSISHKLHLLAHYIQSNTDQHIPIPQWCIPLYEQYTSISYLKTTILPSPLLLRIWGAYGRNLGVSANREKYTVAIEFLQKCTLEWIEQSIPSEASYPLCEWLRISAIVSDKNSWEQAFMAWQKLHHSPTGITMANEDWLRIAIGKSIVLLGEEDNPYWEFGITILKELCSQNTSQPHIRFSAFRWLHIAQKTNHPQLPPSLQRNALFSAWHKFDHNAQIPAELSQTCTWYKHLDPTMQQDRSWVQRCHPYL